MNDLAALIGEIREALIVVDAERNVTGWLGASERLFGWSEQEATGKMVDELLLPRDANDNPCCLGLVPDTKLRTISALPELEFLVKTRAGADVWIGATTAFRRDESGEVTASLIVARDITRRKRIDLAKSEVISAVAHELRSPLTSVKGFTSTLLHRWDRFDDDTKKHLLVTINSDADRVTRLIGELLDISRLESGRLQLRRQMVDVATIATRVIERVGLLSDAHELVSELPDGLPEVFADPDKVEQVLTNLLENAVKYSEKGTVTVKAEEQDGKLSISVTDQGEGIPLDHRAQIFGKFFRRGANVRADNPSGTGLGLYISKGLVEAHGGKLWVDDAPGGGAVFTFTLPRESPTD